jgi:sarcosine oxidase subunit beta
MRKQRDDVLIIGGGLQGCAIAMYLAQAGRQVTIVEKNIAGRHASSVNAGGLRHLLRDIREYPLSIRAMELWRNLADVIGSSAANASEVRLGTSQIAIAVDPAELAWAHTRLDDMRRHGITTEEFIDKEEMRRVLPGLTDTVLGGLISRADGHANPAYAALGFRNAAEAAGATILERCSLNGVSQGSDGAWIAETSAGRLEADQLINCTGAWGASFAASLDEMLPVEAVAYSMMVTARVKPFVNPVVLGIDQPLSFKQSAVGSLVIGGGILGKPCLDQGTSFTVMDRMASSAASVVSAFPMLANVPVVRTWTGLEAITPDGIPIIGPSTKHRGLWHVFGFCGHGFQLAPAIGEIVAQSLINDRVDPGLLAFRANRFAPPSTVRNEGTTP